MNENRRYKFPVTKSVRKGDVMYSIEGNIVNNIVITLYMPDGY